MTQALQYFLSCRDERAEVTGTLIAVAPAVAIRRNGKQAGSIYLTQDDQARLMAYPVLPKSTVGIPLEWFVSALSQPVPQNPATL